MPNNKEIVIEQRRRLYQLLEIKKATTEEERMKIIDSFIKATTTEMDEEDVAYVEKKVNS